MIKYIYIDDENDLTTQAIKDGLNDVHIISVELETPQAFEAQSQDLIKRLNEFDGIILDLRLDDNPKSKAQYTAPPLAQALRSNSSLDLANVDCPIVLCSTDAKIKKSYLADQSSHDLFDYKFLKDHEPDWPKIVAKLNSLAIGYKKIREAKGDLQKILDRNPKELDSRILDRFNDPEIKLPVHEYARFIIKELLGQPGPLINEKVLAARLGIDLSKSNDWSKMLETVFPDVKFKGAFSDGWNRWWADLVINRFKEITGGMRLSGMNAQQRVEALISKTGFNEITPAAPIPRSVSSNFWTICEFYKKPLDPLEGFKIYTQREPKSWQEHRYLSIDAAVERKGFEKGLKIHSSETDRLEMIKEQIKQQAK